jgi:hypothetical protein
MNGVAIQTVLVRDEAANLTTLKSVWSRKGTTPKRPAGGCRHGSTRPAV